MTFARIWQEGEKKWMLMGKGPFLINTPPHTKTHTSAPSSAFFKSNQIPCVLSARPLSGECTQSRAQTCHSEEAKSLYACQKNACPPPKLPHTHTPIFCISVFASTRRAVSYQGPSLSLNFSSSVAEPSWKTQSFASGKRPLGLGWLKPTAWGFLSERPQIIWGESWWEIKCVALGYKWQDGPSMLRLFWEEGLQETRSATVPCQWDRQTARSQIRSLLFQRQATLHARSAQTHSDSVPHQSSSSNGYSLLSG